MAAALRCIVLLIVVVAISFASCVTLDNDKSAEKVVELRQPSDTWPAQSVMAGLEAMRAKPKPQGAPGVFGLDISSGISQTISQGGWTCMHQQGNYSFAIIEGWQGGYGQNGFLSTAVARAWAGGMAHVDVYAFMCPQCSGNGVGAVSSLVNYLRSNGVNFGMIWMDIEQCDGCWYGDLASNCNWVRSLAQQYLSLGIHLGMYSSPYEWGATVGSSCGGFTSLPLWYAHYDGNPSFSDWPSVQFGGWSSPSIKQFDDNAGNSCGISIDRNWYP